MGGTTTICLEPHSLKPLWLVGLGVFIQFYLNQLIAADTWDEFYDNFTSHFCSTCKKRNDNDSENYEDESDHFGGVGTRTISSRAAKLKGEPKSLRERVNALGYREMSPFETGQRQEVSDIWTTLRSALIVFQVLCVLLVFAMDLVRFVQLTTHLSRNRGSWHKYQCFVEVMMDSSNFKTIFVGFLQLNDDSVLRVHRLATDKLASFWREFLQRAIILYAPIIVVPMIPGIVVYGWLMAAVVVVGMLIYKLMPADDGSGETQQNGVVKDPFFVCLLFMAFLWPTLAAVYWFSGKFAYFEAFVHVITVERKWRAYRKKMVGSARNIIQFITCIL